MQDAASDSENTFPLPKSEEQVPLRWHTAGIELHWAQGREEKPFYLSGSGKEMYKEKKKKEEEDKIISQFKYTGVGFPLLSCGIPLALAG